jgi:hypothetical protein
MRYLAIFAAVLALATPALAQSEAPASMKYLAVPVAGEVGKEITARGVRNAIRAARSKKADAVVFVIDTNGGRVADADAIGKVMDDERGNLKYYSIVVKTISAGVWPLTRSDKIFFAPGGSAGAAVAFSYNPETGSAEVDAKFCAAVAAKLAAAAESHGQPAAVYRAMVVKDERLFRYTDAKGKVCVCNQEPPAGSKDPREIDTKNSVLALTPAEAEEIGFGVSVPSADPADIGAWIDVASWTAAGPPAAGPMREGAKEVQARAEATEAARKRIVHARESLAEFASRLPNQRKIAVQSEPGVVHVSASGAYSTLGGSGTWTERCDAAIREWEEILSLCTGIEQAQAAAERALKDLNAAQAREAEARLLTEKPKDVELEPVEIKQDVAAYRREANQKIAQLKMSRLNTSGR